MHLVSSSISGGGSGISVSSVSCGIGGGSSSISSRGSSIASGYSARVSSEVTIGKTSSISLDGDSLSRGSGHSGGENDLTINKVYYNSEA